MTFSAEQAAVVRTPTILVKLRLDYCQNTFGQAPCTAIGTPCYYTYVTCKDKPNYARGVKDYRFSAYQGAPLADALPYLTKMATVPTEIKTDQHVTRVAEIHLEFHDDRPLPLADPNKAVHNFESAGTFWRNFLARNPNYRGRPAEVWRGFGGVPETDYELVFKGLITNVTVAEGRCTITLQDYLKKLEVKVPAEQSSENTLTVAYAGGAELMVVDASEFADATPGQPGLVKVEDENNGSEYVSYAGRSLSENKLFGCQGGRFGTKAVSHPVGCRVSNAVVWAEDNGMDGLPLDQIVLDLLVTHGGISGLDLAALDLGATLGSDIGPADIVQCVGIEDFPATGVVRIGDELIRYSGKGTGMGFQVVDQELGPKDDEHSLDQGTGLEAWHFVRFETSAGDTSLDRVSLKLMRTGSLAGDIYLYLYSDNAGNPGTQLNYLGSKSISLVRVSTYGDLVWDRHLNVTPSTTYWLGYMILVADGTGEIYQSLKGAGNPLIDEELGPRSEDHNMDQGSGSEAWHFVKFETPVGADSFDSVSLKLKRTGVLTGSIHLYLFSNNSGDPGTQLTDLGSKDISQVAQDFYGNLTWDYHAGIDPSTIYWLGYRLEITGGTGDVLHALRAGSVVDQELGPSDADHNIDQGAGYEAWHFIKFTTPAEVNQINTAALKLMRTGSLAGNIYLYLYSHDAANNLPQTQLASLGSKGISLVNVGTYMDLVFTFSNNVSPSTTYWLGYNTYITGGTANVYQALKTDAINTEFLHCQNANPNPSLPGQWQRVAGLPLFRVEWNGAITTEFKHSASASGPFSGIAGRPLFQVLVEVVTSEYKHARSAAGPWTGIAGWPLFVVEKSAGTFDTLSGCQRGAYGTSPAAHSAGAVVWLLEVSDEVSCWLATARYRRFLEKPVAIKDLLRELRQCTLSHLWQGEDSQVHFKCAPVPIFRNPPKQLTDAEHLVRQSLELDRNEEARKTRVTVYYDPLTADSGTDPEQYRAALLHLDQEVEGENYYGEKRNYEIFAPWIYRSAEALNAAAHFLMRFRYGAPMVSFGLELKDSDLQVGDFVSLDTDMILAPDGATRPNALFEVVKKKPTGANRFEYQALEAAGGGVKSYAGISPAPYTADYDSYGDSDHGRYAWISDANEKVGANDDPGYYIS
jgi:hypothetical protein